MADASNLIDERIRELGGWSGQTLREVRRIIKEADAEIVEEWKWAKATSPGTPVWSHNGGICTGERYKTVVKLTFFRGLLWTILHGYSTQPSKERSGVRSTSKNMTRSTKTHCRTSFVKLWH